MACKVVETISVSDANQQFSALVRKVEQEGVSVRILRRDKPVALLVPDSADRNTDKNRQVALADMKKLLKEGISLGGVRFSRDELHDRS